jgi:hypothetical protein
VSVLSRIGLPGFIVLLAFLCLFLYRLLSTEKSRMPFLVGLIIISKVLNPVISGFVQSLQAAQFIGQLNTIFSYVVFIFCAIEIVLSQKNMAWNRNEKLTLVCILLLGIMYLGWSYILNGHLISSDFLFMIQISLVYIARPCANDLRNLPKIALGIIVVIFVLAIMKYQNPLYPYYQTDYGVDGPYHNAIWDLFGYTERLRGPFSHPNQLGVQIVFLSSLLLISKTKLYIFSLVPSYILLALAASRTSLLAITLGLCVRLYFDLTQAFLARSNGRRRNSHRVLKKSNDFQKKLFIGLFFIGSGFLLVKTIVGSNLTGSGRTLGMIDYFRSTSGHYLLGRGPNIENITEVSLVSIISQYGFAGLFLVITAIFGIYRNQKLNVDPFLISSTKCLGVVLFCASVGESLFGGSYIDIGPLYLIIMLILSRAPTI